MIVNQDFHWDTHYDVVVVGFGGAGATAAHFAADAGAKVLLVDSAPAGEEGGNTRYSAQMISVSDDFDAEKTYFSHLTAPMHLDDDMIATFAQGMVDLPGYLRDYLGVTKPFSLKANWENPIFAPVKKSLVENTIEYPELPGSDHHDVLAVHPGLFDAALWKLLRAEVVKRAANIDVWFDAPATHLLQTPAGTIVGIQIKRDGKFVNVAATNGVVLALGGFENNVTKIQDFLGAASLIPVGTLYNTGKGVDLAIEAGASLWHMQNFESLGLLHGMALKVSGQKRGYLFTAPWPTLSTGAIITAGDDGSRYFKEDESNRHGHLYNHGIWRVPQNQVHPHLVFDQTQYDLFKKQESLPVPPILPLAVKADSLDELADKIDAKPEVLAQTVADFNFFADQGRDYAHNREVSTLRKFDDGPYYAVALEQTILNTQGGPRHNINAEVLDTNLNVIPHLYAAGELGGISAGQYQAGENLAECLIFGKIAGENAATEKATSADQVGDGQQPAASQVAFKSDLTTDASQFSVGPNQYIGTSSAGIGNEVVVRVTLDDNHAIKNVEILQQSESADVGSLAVKELPKRMVEQNTYEVDAVAGASSSSRAIKDAVRDALSKVK